MNPKEINHRFGNAIFPLLFTALCLALINPPVRASDGADAIPDGTILPVRLNSTISSAKCKPGQRVTARIMQNVPLSTGASIRAGSKVIGHVVDVRTEASGEPARVSLQFDKLISAHQSIPITTDLRAIVGFMGVMDAQTPTTGAGEGDVYRWLTTVQVGGDVVYGEGGPVTSGANSTEVVGKAVYGGVLSKVTAKEGTKCRGPLDGDNRAQALWVFSSDACGTYGLDHIRILHAGRADPTGVIVLASESGTIKISDGAGLLLRVIARNNGLSAAR